MKILVVGCGKVGSEIARDLAGSKEVSSVVAVDADPDNLARMKPWTKIRTARVDVSQKRVLQRLMRNVDLVCGALPGRLGFELMRQAVEAGRDLVDISYTPKDPFQLHRKALAGGCTLVPQCGVAPGLTNMCVGDASKRLERLRKVRIFVGGLPQKPEPPLNYRIVFSLEDVVNEYTRPPRVVENGAVKFAEPLSGRGPMNFPGVGRLEYFLTDGLGTLPRSFPQVPEMHEYTLRYPGHAEMMNTLRLLGFFDRRKVRVDRTSVEPRIFTLELLKSILTGGAAEDLLALRVEVEGLFNRKRTSIFYQLLDRFDKRHGVSSMARTTAYPCTSVALLIGQKRLRGKGVVPPEEIAQNPVHFKFIRSRLWEKGIRLTTRVKSSGIGPRKARSDAIPFLGLGD